MEYNTISIFHQCAVNLFSIDTDLIDVICDSELASYVNPFAPES